MITKAEMKMLCDSSVGVSNSAKMKASEEEFQPLMTALSDRPRVPVLLQAKQQTHQKGSYDTFDSDGREHDTTIKATGGYSAIHTLIPALRCPRNTLLGNLSRNPKVPKFSFKGVENLPNTQPLCLWRMGLILAALMVVMAYFYQLHDPYSYIAPEWTWDHNIYVDRHGRESVSEGRAESSFLIAQISGGRSFRELASISSRPNRAYARDWGIDYVEYNSGKSAYDPKNCFDKVSVLNRLLEAKERQEKGLELIFSRSDVPEYKALLILSLDSIIVELEEDLFDSILPDKDKLVAISGWDGNKLHSSADVLLFNLEHRHIHTVAALWWKLSLPREITCGERNDIAMLVDAISQVLQSGESMVDFIQPLNATSDGAIGRNWIKSLQNTVPGARSISLLGNLQESCRKAAEIADSTCYRYYPKCEVLS